MKERPILFSAPMVRALLDGTKTQTRRVSGLEVINAEPGRYDFRGVTSGPGVPHFAFHDRESGAQVLVRCRHGQPGDRLWVREAFRNRAIGEAGHQESGPWVYRATENVDGLAERWTPSIHMPRAASRIDLEVTSVRIERLQEISRDDAKAEGCSHDDPCDHVRLSCAEIGCTGPDYRVGYRKLWEQINGAGSWDESPWVWVIGFRRIRP